MYFLVSLKSIKLFGGPPCNQKHYSFQNFEKKRPYCVVNTLTADYIKAFQFRSIEWAILFRIVCSRHIQPPKINVKTLTKLKDNRFLIYFNLAEPTQIESIKSNFLGCNCFPYYLARDNEIKPIDQFDWLRARAHASVSV